MKLIVGLGNPGPKYQLTRHNIGFLLVDALVEIFGENRSYKSEFKAETAKVKIGGDLVMVCKPQTFMNLSGEAVQPLMAFYNIPKENLLVAHDEVDIAFGQLRFQKNRGHGGHNGIRSIHQLLGSEDYCRLRIGVSRPPQPGPPVSDWVLQNFSADEQKMLPDFLSKCCDAVAVFVREGLAKASTQFNSKGD